MNKSPRFYKSIVLSILATFVFQMAACGTLLYPERRGQKTGQIDTGVALLDAIGLLFFVVPGVVAFAVDFSTGAIFLPPGTKKSPLFTSETMQVVYLDVKDLSQENIEKVLVEHTNHRISLSHADVMISKVKRPKLFLSDYKHFVELEKIPNE